MKVYNFMTIFTPTYNRANTLTRLYTSLKNQTNQCFEWLVVDDGSTDDTEIIINTFKSEGLINIRYLKQGNLGKQAAWNKAIKEARGDLFCGIDSDDSFFDEYCVENIYCKYTDLLVKSNIVGLRFLAYSSVKKDFDTIGLEEKIGVHSYFEEFSNPKVKGEMIDVLKTEVIRSFLYPISSDIRFIPEVWFYVALSKSNYHFVYIPEPLRMFYDDELINRLGRSSVRKHAKGHYISRSSILKNIPLKYLMANKKEYLISCIRFSQCANYLGVSLKKRISDTNFYYGILSFFLVIFNLRFK